MSNLLKLCKSITTTHSWGSKFCSLTKHWVKQFLLSFQSPTTQLHWTTLGSIIVKSGGQGLNPFCEMVLYLVFLQLFTATSLIYSRETVYRSPSASITPGAFGQVAGLRNKVPFSCSEKSSHPTENHPHKNKRLSGLLYPSSLCAYILHGSASYELSAHLLKSFSVSSASSP